MKKAAFLLVLFSIVVLAMQPTMAEQRTKVNPQITIANIQTNQVFYPGQTIDVTVTMNPNAVGVAKKLKTTFSKANQIIVETPIDNPQASNSLKLQLPANLPKGSYVIHAILWPPSAFSVAYGTQVVVKVEEPPKINPNLNIVGINDGDKFQKGQTITLNVTMDSKAVGIANKMNLSVKLYNQTLASKEINNPQSSNQAVLQLPLDITTGEGILEAIIYPQDAFTQCLYIKKIIITGIDPQINITNINTGDVFQAGQAIKVIVTINPAVVGISKKLRVVIGKGGSLIITENWLNNPQATTEATLQIPTDVETGNYTLQAVLAEPISPYSPFLYAATKLIKIEKK